MISIKKHLEASSDLRSMSAVYGGVVAEIVRAAARSIPCADEAERARFDRRLTAWEQDFLELGDAVQVTSAGEAAVALLENQSDRAAGYYESRERELTAIITLLAETAGRLDATNRDFYESLHEQVRQLESVGAIDDISELREELSKRLSRLDESVMQQEQAMTELGKFQGFLESAQQKVEALGALVTTNRLGSLPSRTHGEQFLEDMTSLNRPFATAVILLDRLDSVRRRYGDEKAEEILAAFADRFQSATPAQLHAYRWEESAVVALADGMTESEVRERLNVFVRELSGVPLAEDERGRPLHIDPRYLVQQGEAASSEDIRKLIERLSS